MQKDVQDKIYQVIEDYIPKGVLNNKNKARTWEYGYNEKYNIIVISKNGTLGEVVSISGLKIGLPLSPKNIITRNSKRSEQYWERHELPKELSKVHSIFQWNEMPSNFKAKWVDYIETEFDRREDGHWFMNNGTPSYITGAHYMYLQWSSIDIGYPDFREANRIFFIFW